MNKYNKYPATEVGGEILAGWDAVLEKIAGLAQSEGVVALEAYPGVYEEDITRRLLSAGCNLVTTRSLMKDPEVIEKMTARYMTDDVLFGYVTSLRIGDYFDREKIAGVIPSLNGKTVVFGPGASFAAPAARTVIFADMARWEIIGRFRKGAVDGLGVRNRDEAVSLQYKRGYFIDWRVMDLHKESLMERVDYWLDTNDHSRPKMIPRKTFFEGLRKTTLGPFRTVPFFDPAPWGGQWMKGVCELDRNKDNYGWCFDCVPEENSLLLDVGGEIFEMPSMNLVLAFPDEVLGEAVAARFGKEFPIRFDFLDTMDGGNLSLQVHPTTDYIRKTFGMPYTQDESYYIVDAKEDATVYLGLRSGVDKEEMIAELRRAQRECTVFDPEKYVNRLPAKKHDHFLIPAGTVHCSGKNTVVLEISSTPNLFTFKMWDWERLGLDGKPRPINIDHASAVIDWRRDTPYVEKYLANTVQTVASGQGWTEERTGLHANQFIETRRHRFTRAVRHTTEGSVNVLNLVEGEGCIVESPHGKFAPFAVNYAETFIVPASIGDYVITPVGEKECVTIKARVRI